jgi:hypothetical protein
MDWKESNLSLSCDVSTQVGADHKKSLLTLEYVSSNFGVVSHVRDFEGLEYQPPIRNHVVLVELHNSKLNPKECLSVRIFRHLGVS